MEVLIFFYLFLAFAVAFVFGTARTIGFWNSFLLSLLLSPVLGLIISLFFPTTESANRQKEMLETQKSTLAAINQNKTNGIASELEKLVTLKDQGHITEAEYNDMKFKLLK